MDTKQAAKRAARESKAQGTRYVVWVPDQGRDVYGPEQMKRYEALVFVEAVFLGGVQISTTEAA